MVTCPIVETAFTHIEIFQKNFPKVMGIDGDEGVAGGEAQSHGGDVACGSFCAEVQRGWIFPSGGKMRVCWYEKESECFPARLPSNHSLAQLV